jgi:head-tail adaptor
MRHDDLIAILDRAPGVDGAGEPNGEWIARDPIWANAQFPTGAAMMRAASVHADAQVSIARASFRVWADETLNTLQRVRHLGRDYDINDVLPDSNDRRFVFLSCARAT